MRLIRYTAVFVIPDDAELAEVKKDFAHVHSRGVSAGYQLIRAGANFAAAQNQQQVSDYVAKFFLPNGKLREG